MYDMGVLCVRLVEGQSRMVGDDDQVLVCSVFFLLLAAQRAVHMCDVCRSNLETLDMLHRPLLAAIQHRFLLPWCKARRACGKQAVSRFAGQLSLTDGSMSGACWGCAMPLFAGDLHLIGVKGSAPICAHGVVSAGLVLSGAVRVWCST